MYTNNSIFYLICSYLALIPSAVAVAAALAVVAVVVFLPLPAAVEPLV